MFRSGGVRPGMMDVPAGSGRSAGAEALCRPDIGR